MQIPKPTDADKDRFRALVPDSPDVEVKPMFGNLGAFVHGNMFAGLFGITKQYAHRVRLEALRPTVRWRDPTAG